MLRARFEPTRPVRRLKLELWSPPQLGTDQQVEIELAGRRWTQHLRPGMRTSFELDLRLRAGEAVELAIRAARTWKPSGDSADGDQRALAYRLTGAELVH